MPELLILIDGAVFGMLCCHELPRIDMAFAMLHISGYSKSPDTIIMEDSDPSQFLLSFAWEHRVITDTADRKDGTEHE
jgi:hypothetical protein